MVLKYYKNLEILLIFQLFSLTSKDDEIDQLLGLKMGADDYITKPFSQKLLIERVKVILKGYHL